MTGVQTCALPISLLSKDSRMPLTKIASEVRLSRDAVDYRIKRLMNKHVIQRFVPLLHIRKFGYYRFHVFFLLDEANKERQKEFISYLCNHPSIRSVMEYSDRWDIEATLIAKGLREFDIIFTEITSKFSDIIIDKSRMQVIKNYNSVHLPYVFYKGLYSSTQTAIQDEEVFDLDDKDVKILRFLTEDARTSTYKIAEEVGLSPDAVSYRINRMVKGGVIIKFTLLLNLSMLKFQWYTFTMKFKNFNIEQERKFREYVKQHSNIIRAVKVMGEKDVMLYIVAASATTFHQTIKDIKNEFADIIETYETWLAYKEHFYNPFPAILEKRARNKVLIFGSFDLLHPGHISLFKDAKKLGDHLTVVVARNSTIQKVKGHKPKYDENDRLEHVKELGGDEVEIFMDSELIVKQIKGEYKVKNQDLAVFYLKVHNLLVGFKKYTIAHVMREKNTAADAQVNKAIDAHTK